MGGNGEFIPLLPELMWWPLFQPLVSQNDSKLLRNWFSGVPPCKMILIHILLIFQAITLDSSCLMYTSCSDLLTWFPFTTERIYLAKYTFQSHFTYLIKFHPHNCHWPMALSKWRNWGSESSIIPSKVIGALKDRGDPTGKCFLHSWRINTFDLSWLQGCFLGNQCKKDHS